ncbi:MAG TPA: S8 family serine peptidase [Phycisphaerae bacterium]|nr:S8 family serine peptidase [Phycisphaerae bacterium]
MSVTTRTLIAKRTWRYGLVAVVGLVCLTAARQAVRGQDASRKPDALDQAAPVRVESAAHALTATGQKAAPAKAEPAAAAIEPNLERILAQTPADQTLSVLVFLSEQVNLDAITAQMDARRATLRERHETVVFALQATAAATQGNLLTHLNALQQCGRIEEFQPFWVANSIRVDAPKDVIGELAARPDVGMIYFNYPIETIEPVAEPAKGPDGIRSREPEPGLIAVRAPEVWAMGFTGEGILVATLDTGVDGNHPALASRWRGVADPRYDGHPEWAWFDPVTHTTFPQAFGSHGTHTMGTVCGGAPGDQIGVAPGAQWIHAAVIDRVSIPQTIADAKLAFQWMLDPDEDPSTNWDVPAVCSNSWRLATYHGYPPCWDEFWSYLDACEAAGIVILFSAGNEGPAPQTIGRPPDRATTEYMCCAVGAVDAQNPNPPWPVAGFSSRGPSYCTPGGEEAIKPELAAPGVNVRSSVPGGGYQGDGWSGTSMASPHVNGAVALVRQACPDLTVQQVLQILYDTAHDQGPNGNDNDYGFGMLDAYEAVQLAQSMCSGLWISFPSGLPDMLTPGEPTLIDVKITANDEDYVEGSGMLHYRYSGDEFQTVPFVPQGGDMYQATLPAAHCDDTPEFYFSAEGTESGVVYMPPNAPDETYSAVVAVPEFVTTFTDDLDTDPGWTTQSQWAFGQPTGGGGEYGGPDPTSGHTGSNVYGYNLQGDYPDYMPEYHLTSTAIDCTGLINVHLKFWRWLGVEQPAYDHAYIRVSNDGTNWTTVWQNPTEITDYSWVEMDVDISAAADDEPTVYLRWTMGTTDGGWRYCGWNIDDVQLVAFVCEEEIPGDLNGDGCVDQQDLGVLLADWDCTGGDCPGDCDGDGDTDQEDLGILLAHWGEGCP